MPYFVSATITFSLVLLQLKVICSQEPVLQYRRAEIVNVNLIVLGCADAADAELRARPVFYFNIHVFYDFGESEVNDPNRVVVTISAQNDEEIYFVIDRNAEGRYSCSFSRLGAISIPVDIIGKSIPTPLHTLDLNNLYMYHNVALPDPIFSPSSHVRAVKVGSQTRISCPEQPGFLLQYYSITWNNNSTNQTIARHDPQMPDQLTDDRFRVDEDTLDLIIRSVRLTDSTLVQCELMVRDPQDGNRISSYLPNSIRRIVYGKQRSVSLGHYGGRVFKF